MTQLTKLGFFPLYVSLLLMMPGGAPAASPAAEAAVRRNVEESQALVLLRGLPTLGTKHSIAVVELNPVARGVSRCATSSSSSAISGW